MAGKRTSLLSDMTTTAMLCVVCFTCMIAVPVSALSKTITFYATSDSDFRDAYLALIAEDESLSEADCKKLSEWQCLCIGKTLPLRIQKPTKKELGTGRKLYDKLLNKGQAEDKALLNATTSVISAIQTDISNKCKKPVFAY